MAASPHNKGYLQVNLGNYGVHLVHRLVWQYHTGEEPDGILDHIDGNKTNNKIENLRIVSYQENAWNSDKANGYHKHGDRFRAQITVNRKKIHLGLFETEEEANLAYLKAKESLHSVEGEKIGNRFYEAQLKATGQCPGIKGKKQRKKSMAWDDDKKAKAVKLYKEGEPTPENSMEIVKEIAEELEESPNGVRMILVKAGVYVAKGTATGTSTSTKKEGSSKVSKTAAFEQLNAAIRDLGLEPNAEIIEKLTGKAALYFAEVLSSVKAA